MRYFLSRFLARLLARLAARLERNRPDQTMELSVLDIEFVDSG